VDIWVRIPDPDEGRVAVRVVLDPRGHRLATPGLVQPLPAAINSGICVAVLGRAIGEGQDYPGLPAVGVPHEIAVDKGAEHLGRFRTL
jgi:hypothetical protein